jgi:hypothetical protein
VSVAGRLSELNRMVRLFRLADLIVATRSAEIS